MDAATDKKVFFRDLKKLMLPIVFQNLISAVVSTADVLMLSGVSRDALSASSLAGQVTFVLTLFYFGLSTGASVLAAQYRGKDDTATIEKVQGLALRYSCVISVLFFLAALCIPQMLMRIFTDDARLITLGAGYLRWVSVSYLMMGVSQMVLAVMRSVGETKLCAQISASCLICNVALNAAAIYLLFPGNESAALSGVAGATSLARILETAFCLAFAARGRGARLDLRACVSTEKWLSRDFRKCTLPVQMNYLIWGGATAAIAAIMGHIGSDVVAANSLASTLRSLVIVGCGGLGTAGSIMIGNALGKDDLEGARWMGSKIFAWSLLFGAASGLVLLLLYRPCLAVAKPDGEVARLFGWMLVVNAVYCIGKSFNSSMVSGVFAAGGDTRFGLICDAAAMWGVVLPLGFFAAFVWRWPPVAVYVVLCMDEFVKLPFVAARFGKYKWLKNLTRTESEMTAES